MLKNQQTSCIINLCPIKDIKVINVCHMKEAFFFVVGVGDIFPTRIDMRDHLMLLHFLVLDLDFFLVHVLDLELEPLPVLQQVV